jgi:hypothetical protein
MGTFSRRAVLFGGTNEYATGGNVHDFANNVDFSIGGWFRFGTVGTNMALISKRATAGNAEGYELRRQSNGRIGLFLVGTDGTQVYIVTSASYDDGTYHLVGFTWEGTAGNAAANATIYVDGVAVALDAPVTDTLAATISNTAPFQVSGQNGTTNVLVGQADDVFVQASGPPSSTAMTRPT